MSETKGDEEMVEAHLPDDLEEEDLIDAKPKQDVQLPPSSMEVQNLVGNGELPPPSMEAEDSFNRNVELSVESDEKEGSLEPHYDPVVEGNNAHDANVMPPADLAEPSAFNNGVSDQKIKDGNVSEVNELYVANVIVSNENGGNASPSQELAIKGCHQLGEETPKAPCSVGQGIDDDDQLAGTEEEQAAFIKEVECFYREKGLEFKPPKFYGKELNCLKLWRGVTRFGGYDKVTACKLWKHVGGAFKPPRTCTTVSWTFRSFYEKALLEYERHKVQSGELSFPFAAVTDSMSVENQISANPASGSGRVRRDAAARAIQGWHSQRLLGNGEVGDPIIKDKSPISMPIHEKQTETNDVIKGKKSSHLEHATKALHATAKATKLQKDVKIVDIGPLADWVKINVRKTKDCFEVYALVPGLLREEIRVQSDPAGRLVISGEPENPDNPWGVTPFKKVVSLPSRINPLNTSAVVTLHGQLFVRAPFDQSKA